MNTRLFPLVALFALAAPAFAQDPANTNALASPDNPTHLEIIVPRLPSPPTAAALSPLRPNVSLTTNALLGFVNSEPVFANDLFRPIDAELRSLAANAKDLTQFRTQARALPSRRRVRKPDPEIRRHLRLLARSPTTKKTRVYMAATLKLCSGHGSQALADQALRAQGTTFEHKLEDERTGTIVKMYMRRQIYPRIVVTRQMVLDEYDRTKHQEDAEIELFTITLRVSCKLRQRTVPTAGSAPSAPTPPISRSNRPNKWPSNKPPISSTSSATALTSPDTRRRQLPRTDSAQLPRRPYAPTVVKRGALVNSALENAAFQLSLLTHVSGEPLLIKDPDFRRETVVVFKVRVRKKKPAPSPSPKPRKISTTPSKPGSTCSSSTNTPKNSTARAASRTVDQMTSVAVDVAVARYATE